MYLHLYPLFNKKYFLFIFNTKLLSISRNRLGAMRLWGSCVRFPDGGLQIHYTKTCFSQIIQVPRHPHLLLPPLRSSNLVVNTFLLGWLENRSFPKIPSFINWNSGIIYVCFVLYFLFIIILVTIACVEVQNCKS